MKDISWSVGLAKLFSCIAKPFSYPAKTSILYLSKEQKDVNFVFTDIKEKQLKET